MNLLRLLDQLFWALRRKGLTISTSQAIDGVKAVSLVGFDDREALRWALSASLVQRPSQQALFDVVFDRFFDPGDAHARDLEGRLGALGFSRETIGKLTSLLGALAATDDGAGAAARLLLSVTRGEPLDARLASAEVSTLLSGLASPSQAGYFAVKLEGRLGLSAAVRAMPRLRVLLVAELGEDEGGRLFDALSRELSLLRAEARRHVDERASPPPERRSDDPLDTPFARLTPDDARAVRRAVAVLAERLRGRAMVRRRRQRHGRVQPGRTMRQALRTGGVVFRLVRRARPRQKARLVVLCDVSESVRSASSFLLELVAQLHELFDKTRSFVFVADVGEVTALLERDGIDSALRSIASGAVVSVTANSSYGRALRAFEQQTGASIDRRTTVIIVGDGRTNYGPPEVDVLERLRGRAGALYWLCPEPRSSWTSGDSAMARYAAVCTRVLPATTGRELEEAARALVPVR